MNYNFQPADTRCPNMGLYGIPCESPKYWCALHQVWLSEEDAKKKHCRQRPTMDMISTYQCGNLKERNYDEFVRKINNNGGKNNEQKQPIASGV